jgi:hypothetical protein
MNLKFARDLLLDALQEALELARAVASVKISDDPPGGDIEGGEQRGGAVPAVVVGAPLRDSRSHGQDRLSAVQGLDLALLIDAEDHGPVWRIQIETDDVPNLLHELGIGGELEGLGPMRLESKCMPDPTHRGITQPAASRHRACTPVGGIGRHRLQGGVHQCLDLIVADLAWRSRARFIQQSRQAPLKVARPPLSDGVVGDPELASHGAVGDAVGAPEQDPCSLSKRVAGLRKLGPAQELGAILVGDAKRCLGATEWHDVNLSVSADWSRSIIASTSVSEY